MSDVMAGWRKMNTSRARQAARETVRERVSAHNDQVVMFIWGCRVLGWSLRRTAAGLDVSIPPPGRRAGYRAGKWMAAAIHLPTV